MVGDLPRLLPQARHLDASEASAVLARIRHKVFVMSGKGGVGKSSVSVNLAVALAGLGYRIGLLDVDFHGPSVPRLLGLAPGAAARMDGGLFMPERAADKLLVLSLDILLKERDQAVIWRGPKKAAMIRRLLSGTAWGDLDFLLVDSPPGTGDEHLGVLRSIPDALCLVVTTPHEIALADVRKALNFLRVMQARVLGLVENMASLRCPHCKEPIALYAGEGGRALAAEHNLPLLGSIPFDPAVMRAAEQGRPAAALPGENPVKTAFLDLAARALATCSAYTGR